MSIKSINPYDLTLLKEYVEYSEQQVDDRLRVAESAYMEWKATSFSYRNELFKKCADMLESNALELAKLITLEMGKPLKESIAEINKCAMVCNFYAENGEEFLKSNEVQMSSAKAYTVFQPLGGILAVMPWNFPFWQVFRFAIPTLYSGNVGILKHASNVPQCSLAIEEVFIKSGFPKGIFTSLLVSSGKIERLLAHDFIKAVSLTGSEKAGSEVAALAGRNIKKSLLELGGSDPFIVLEDADILRAAESGVKTRMINNGQSCISAKRFIIVESVYEKFLNLFIENLNQLKMGNPMDMETEIGPMAREDLRNDLLQKIKENVDLGSKLVIGGSKGALGGAFLQPTILENIKPGMPAYEEEMFGPVAAFIKVKDSSEAIKIANDTKYGLGASIWTKDFEKGEELALKIDAGNVFINGIVASDPKLPFGGIKFSGYGRELSSYGIKEYVNIKTIHHQLK